MANDSLRYIRNWYYFGLPLNFHGRAESSELVFGHISPGCQPPE